MLYQGQPLIPQVIQSEDPERFNFPESLGLTDQRANEIIDAIHLHVNNCNSEESLDLRAAYTAAPLDIQSPSEALFVGYVLEKMIAQQKRKGELAALLSSLQ